MEIPQKLLKLKFHLISASFLSLLLLSILFLSPSFITLISYFWPLFLSTALSLTAIVFFAKVSPPISEDITSCEKAGEGLLDYVAGGQPDNIIIPELISDDDEEDDYEPPVNVKLKSEIRSEEVSEVPVPKDSQD